MKIQKRNFGLLSNGKKASLYTLKAGDISFSVTDFGGHWVSLYIPQKNGQADDILLGFSTLEGYTKGTYIGATIGRFGNRIANAAFKLDGKDYHLFKNDGNNSLHGGLKAFNNRLWDAEAFELDDGVYVRLELDSPDGEEGFPGNMKAVVTYGINKNHELIALYEAKVDKNCPVNFTNHAYFNLAGEGSGLVHKQQARFYADSYVEVDANLIPTGKLLPTKGTAFDFSEFKEIGKDFDKTGIDGYDHCYVLPKGEEGKLQAATEFADPGSGRIMRIFTSQPSFQFYTATSLKPTMGKTGSVYTRHSGFCLETQHLPDSPNQASFPSAIFGPEREYKERAVFAFDW
ncbi:MAG: galactose mutarotase [Spirochaetaceae bacterium]|jgi:aldose 1-epimerase|nr:galactose mutarotase [Spirochaetaceae bacterium]